MLFTIVNERSRLTEVVDQLTASVKVVFFRPSQNQENSKSALPQLSCGSNNATWTRKSGQADPPETSTYKWLAARHVLIRPHRTFWVVTSSDKSGSGNNGNKGVLEFSQRSRTSTSPSHSLVFYLGHSLRESYHSEEMQSVYSTAPSGRAQ